MTAIDDYLAARAAFVDHDALVVEMADGLKPEMADRMGDWRRVSFRDTHPPGGFPAGTTDRVIETHDWPFESAKMIEATLATWHRLAGRDAGGVGRAVGGGAGRSRSDSRGSRLTVRCR